MQIIVLNEIITFFRTLKLESTFVFDNFHVMETDNSSFIGKINQLIHKKDKTDRFLILRVANNTSNPELIVD